MATGIAARGDRRAWRPPDSQAGYFSGDLGAREGVVISSLPARVGEVLACTENYSSAVPRRRAAAGELGKSRDESPGAARIRPAQAATPPWSPPSSHAAGVSADAGGACVVGVAPLGPMAGAGVAGLAISS